ncbi:hypothetical protein [Trujillonella endophytica]|uniref:hypothetical protein n=1 Tax=Trujillonella endophytica TaxID=673521 RepID=UPI001114305C|nr:hypothetical protein [Trujillella endophytica]
MAHRRPHRAVGDAAPDPVADAELGLDQRVHEVVREVFAAARTADGEHHAVVPFDQRLDGAPVGHPREGEPHAVQHRGPAKRFPERITG